MGSTSRANGEGFESRFPLNRRALGMAAQPSPGACSGVEIVGRLGWGVALLLLLLLVDDRPVGLGEERQRGARERDEDGEIGERAGDASRR